MSVPELIQYIRQLKGCHVYSPKGIPEVGMKLPRDIELFYTLCGGVALFQSHLYSMNIVPPNDFVRANPIIVGDDGIGDISHDWFIIAESGEQYVTIDLDPSRCGRCYDSFWDRHAVPGACPVIALSFRSLLEQLVKSDGKCLYWLESGFPKSGDAYDDYIVT